MMTLLTIHTIPILGMLVYAKFYADIHCRHVNIKIQEYQDITKLWALEVCVLKTLLDLKYLKSMISLSVII